MQKYILPDSSLRHICKYTPQLLFLNPMFLFFTLCFSRLISKRFRHNCFFLEPAFSEKYKTPHKKKAPIKRTIFNLFLLSFITLSFLAGKKECYLTILPMLFHFYNGKFTYFLLPLENGNSKEQSRLHQYTFSTQTAVYQSQTAQKFNQIRHDDLNRHNKHRRTGRTNRINAVNYRISNKSSQCST